MKTVATTQGATVAARLSRRKSGGRGATWAGVCQVALKLPGVERGTCYGTPALRVRKKFLARLKENREDVAIWIDFADRDVLLDLDPDAFYLTDHYRPYPAMLVRLKRVRRDLLARVIEQAWRSRAPKSLLTRASPDKPARPRRKAKKLTSADGRSRPGSDAW